MAPLQVLSLNCWGLWLVSKKRYNRILHLAEYLANDTKEKHELDVILLQEVWVDADVQLLTSAARQAGLTHCMHFKSGVFGSGLVTISRYPIIDADFHQYKAAGDPASVHCGDFLATKGVGWVRVQTPSGPLDVFNTHLHANYDHSKRPLLPAEGGVPAACIDDYAAFRMAQVVELGRYVSGTVGAHSPPLGVVLGGDLNCAPETLEAAVLTQALLPQLKDAWVAAHGPQDPGHTCKAEENTFKPKRQVAARIDYVLTSLNVTSCELALKHTPQGHSYSDHFAVHATLRLPAQPPTANPLASGAAPAEKRLALLEAAQRVVGGGVEAAGQAAVGHMCFAFIMLVQALGLCLFEPGMTYLGRSLHPTLKYLIPLVSALLAFAASALLLTGLVADGGQSRALQCAAMALQARVNGLRGTGKEGKDKGR
ncbi:hypothetical protein HYH03_016347 [Edaphochlamys debaryana]|uniref:Endonuclease/exonuclease/phosphatase domain-containing protein n=1 Tax=Edaphochlamys debaryana TaxID=47281 RepID=A0A835XJC0_9CHLO|nr:hypothetical protein HYH03_016347 [Edaphochlamys debaryana]|eukprot:KAG2484861.1 hypothetical protein HYH03_016347 [Edaphochlamys debaryana]